MTASAARPRRNLVLFAAGVVLVAALVAAGAYWWTQTYRRVTVSIDLPPKGEAAYNPLYALKMALRGQGKRVDARQSLRLHAHPLKTHDTVILLTDPRTLSKQDGEGLLDWVEGGGHLILSTPPPGAAIGDVPVPVLTDLGVTVLDQEPTCLGLQVPKQDHHVEFCGGRPFYFDTSGTRFLAEWYEEKSGDYGYARVAHGKGSVDVLAELDFLQNDKLADAPHIALTRQLLAPHWNSGGTFHLIYSADMPSWWRLLLNHGWRALLASTLALLVWLWMRAERLGPLLPSPDMDRRSLLEHVQASGDHLYRYGRRATLYAAVHEAFLRRLRQRDPYAAALEGPARVEAIARRTGLAATEIEAALRYPRVDDRKDFVLRIAKLLLLRRRL